MKRTPQKKKKNSQDGDVGADPNIVANRDGSTGAQLGRPSPFQADWVCCCVLVSCLVGHRLPHWDASAAVRDKRSRNLDPREQLPFARTG